MIKSRSEFHNNSLNVKMKYISERFV